MEHPSSPATAEPKPLLVVRDEMWELLQRDPGLVQAAQAVKADASRRGLTGAELLTELARQGRRPVHAPVRTRLSDFDPPEGSSASVPEPEPVYWFCNSCGEEVEDETAECCVDGEIEPSYDEPAT